MADNGCWKTRMCPPWGGNQESWFRIKLGEVVAGKGNTPLLVPNENDDLPQCVLRDVIGSSTIWEGCLMRKHV
jgi:hypothetical protein